MKILVTRFSAFGDVCLTLPVINQLRVQYPKLDVVVLTRSQFVPLFTLVRNIIVIGVDFNTEYKAPGGIWKLYRNVVRHHQINIVLDLHQVLRTHILNLLFKLKGIPVYSIDKGRRDKKFFIAGKLDKGQKLMHTTKRYAVVFENAGFPIEISKLQRHQFEFSASTVLSRFLKRYEGKKIALAPFAQHKQKKYPLNRIDELLKSWDQQGIHVFILGGGKEEYTAAMSMEEQYSNVHSVIGKFTLLEEGALINSCDLCLTMDSGNMHLAALTNTPVFSIWGATHPYLGFSPYRRNGGTEIQIPIDDLSCRPCSVFGNVACHRGDHACMEHLRPEDVLKKTKAIG